MDVENRSLKREEAVKRVYAALRRRAIDSGEVIDDTFSGVSGISSQLQKLKFVIENVYQAADCKCFTGIYGSGEPLLLGERRV